MKEHSICSKSDQAARLHLMHLQLILYMLMAATHTHTHLHDHDEAHSFHDTQNDSFQSTHIFFLIYIYFRQRHCAAIQHPLCYHFLFSSGGSQRDKNLSKSTTNTAFLWSLCSRKLPSDACLLICCLITRPRSFINALPSLFCIITMLTLIHSHLIAMIRLHLMLLHHSHLSPSSSLHLSSSS